MDFRKQFRALLGGPEPILALAPMQDITDVEFWRLQSACGAADVYYTEYFRVYPTSRLDRRILRSVIGNPTGRPVIAQLIGNDIPALVRTARELEQLPVAAIDLNLGCPAPVVYRKCAGGGLLRQPETIDRILGSLREAISIPFTVKTRIGFDSPDVFARLLSILARHHPDLVTVHARTVKEMYRSEVHYEYVSEAVQALPCPVLANGNIYSGAKAQAVLRSTGARGLMMGRSAIRNPWIFAQVRAFLRGEPPSQVRGYDVLEYVRSLYEVACHADMAESSKVQRLKKFTNFIGLGVDPKGEFLHQIRRVTTRTEFFDVCERFLAHDRPMSLDPYPLVLGDGDMLAGVHH